MGIYRVEVFSKLYKVILRSKALTAETENCLSIAQMPPGKTVSDYEQMEGTKIEGMDCLSIIRVGDGREIFTLSRDGELKSLVGQYCLGVKTVGERSPVELINCNNCGIAATCRFDFGSKGDLKMVSQSGSDFNS